MKLKDFYFDLPETLIAQVPLKDRTSSKLMVMDKLTGDIIHEKSFNNILSYLKAGDCIVLNDTKVIPARIFGKKKGTGANIEILLLSRKNETCWEVLVKPGKKAKVGDVITFLEGELEGEIIEICDGGNRIIQFKFEGVFEQILDRVGEMPLPHYITEKLSDKNRYQTVYAKNDGSSAAPTAGLHFTDNLLAEIKNKGIKIAKLTLHVGLGTFRPVKVDNILEHKMHSESYYLSPEQAEIINETKKNNGRVIAVGTTSCRTLETLANEKGEVVSKSGSTDIFIYPGYEFKIVDCLITNFHLPESTLIMLVSAFANRDNVLNAYKIAIENKYRFFSFGDSMFLTNLK